MLHYLLLIDCEKQKCETFNSLSPKEEPVLSGPYHSEIDFRYHVTAINL